MKRLFYDLETTGVDVKKHSIHQIAGYVEIDGVIVEKFDFKTKPHPKAKYDPEALRICGKTEAQLKAYKPMKKVLSEFTKLLSKYVDKYDKEDKLFLVGFNNRGFDDRFLIAWFEQCGDTFIPSWFYFGLDVQALALNYLQDRRAKMPSFKLKRVAMELGLAVDAESLHDAFYDVELTYQVYRIVTGLEDEI